MWAFADEGRLKSSQALIWLMFKEDESSKPINSRITRSWLGLNLTGLSDPILSLRVIIMLFDHFQWPKPQHYQIFAMAYVRIAAELDFDRGIRSD